jgi:leucine efflux protein
MLWSVVNRQKNAHESGPEPASMIMKRSLVLSLTNPKAILFYVSFFVQFIDVNAQSTGTSFLILATTLELISFMYMSFLIFSGAFVTRYLKTKKKLAKLGNGLIGLLFVGFAARLASLH